MDARLLISNCHDLSVCRCRMTLRMPEWLGFWYVQTRLLCPEGRSEPGSRTVRLGPSAMTSRSRAGLRLSLAAPRIICPFKLRLPLPGLFESEIDLNARGVAARSIRLTSAGV